MITINKNDKPKLKTCVMLCDEPLDKKLNKYELTKFLNQHSTNLFIGKPKSGKTSLLYSLFKSKELLYQVFENVYLFQPTQSSKSMKDNIFRKIPEERQFDELTGENLSTVMDSIKETHNDENSCIIIDDMTAYLKNDDVKKVLKELIFNRRHLHTSIYFLCQTWKSVEKDIRKLFNNIFVFKVSKNELENIFEEVVEQKKQLCADIAKLVYDEPYNFLFINTDNQKLFKNWDSLNINV